VDVSGLGLTGLEADEILHETLGVTAELPELRHLTFIVSLGNTVEDGQHCIAGFKALAERDAQRGTGPQAVRDRCQGLVFAEMDYSMPTVTPRTAFFTAAETVAASAAVGRISADTVSAYPPGIPAIVAGEPITAAAIAYLAQIRQQGGYVTGGAVKRLKFLGYWRQRALGAGPPRPSIPLSAGINLSSADTVPTQWPSLRMYTEYAVRFALGLR
jgi:arginine decarboxylase